MASESAAPRPRVTGEERRSAEEDQAQLDRICRFLKERRRRRRARAAAVTTVTAGVLLLATLGGWHLRDPGTRATSVASDPSPAVTPRSEHTSELQSHHDLVCRLLLEKKKK